MIIVKLQGGMGNQMFQYAFGKYLAVKHNAVLKVDTYSLLDRTPRKEHFTFRDYDLDIFNCEVEFATRQEIQRMTHWVKNDLLNKGVRKIIGRKRTHVYESHFHFYEEAMSCGPDVYLEGYWQSEKYFAPIKQIIREDFVISTPLSVRAAVLKQKIESQNAVCVNVRRGDFLLIPNHNVCDINFYQQAEKRILDSIQDPQFYVFSDEIDWCREHLKFSVPTTYVDDSYAGEKFRDKFRLMSACKHFIIPNSSFAWWAAYLSPSERKKVIAPKTWFADPSINTSDLVPPDWIRI